MKRSDIARGTTPLKRNTPLTSKVPLPRSGLGNNERQGPPAKRPRVKPAVPPKVRLVLALRSGGVCEMALSGCTGVATDPAHRLKQGMGGRHGDAKVAHDVLSNLLHACRACHSWTHAEPGRARVLGLMLREGDDSTAVWALYRGLQRWLTDDGLVLAVQP